MHPTQHSTINRKRRLPYIHAIATRGVGLTVRDILNAVATLSEAQNTQFVRIAALAQRLNLTEDSEREWLIGMLVAMDLHGQVLLSPLEKPQDLSASEQAWHVRNASGIPCHELCLSESARLARMRCEPVPYLRAPDGSTYNPSVQAKRIADLLRDAADNLQSLSRQRQRLPFFNAA